MSHIFGVYEEPIMRSEITIDDNIGVIEVNINGHPFLMEKEEFEKLDKNKCGYRLVTKMGEIKGRDNIVRGEWEKQVKRVKDSKNVSTGLHRFLGRKIEDIASLEEKGRITS